MTRAELAAAETRVHLGALLRGLRDAVARRAERTAALDRPGVRELAITERHAASAIAAAEAFARDGRAYGPGAAPSPGEAARLQELRHQARDAGVVLPGDVLAARGLTGLDRDVLLLAAAPALEPSFGDLYAYVHDLRSAAAATLHLAIEALARDADGERRVVEACGPFGTLRADGWLHVDGPDRGALTALRPADGVVELLCGSDVDAGLLGRRAAPATTAAGADPAVVGAMGAALAAGRIDVIGVWTAHRETAAAVTGALLDGAPAVYADGEDAATALQRAAIAGVTCVLDVPADAEAAAALAAALAAASAPAILRGAEPLRDPALMLRRRFAEPPLADEGFAGRRAAWATAFPGLAVAVADDLAARFRLSPGDVEAVAALDRAAGGWATNGHRPGLDALAGTVARRQSPKVASIRTPRRTFDMVVLPPAELDQVLDVAAAVRAWPRVADAWRLERFGNPGVTALFAGESGTGKTLAAEAIAADVGLDLMVVDLSQLVSKWIGETAKHLDAVFGEAEASSCVLFFDEADAIFGQRGEVTRSADRYANLDVGYLLQRLERYEGLVVLASNLRGNLDPAFTRRFTHVVHFPRPGEAERRRLWQLALADPVRLAEPVDLDTFAALNLTGAGIAAIVRSAALATNADGRDALTAADLVAATSRQFQREARLLPRELLGPYAALAG